VGLPEARHLAGTFTETHPGVRRKGGTVPNTLPLALRHDVVVLLPDVDHRPTSIRLFLADGRPDGLRLVEKSNWTGLGLVCSRTDYPRVRTREEWSRPGVYLLTGPAPDQGLRTQLYVGEADDVRDRVDNHLKAKEFWTTVVAFISKDDNINKAHVRYLEARLLQLAKTADRAAVQNGTAPPLPRLSEADQADMEGYLFEMLIILPLLGIVAFEALDRQATPADRLLLTGKDAQANGADTPEGFIVFEGSLARAESVPSFHDYLHDLRHHLVGEGVLVPDGKHLRFTKPHLFDSPSSAAAIVLGRTANGRIEWKDEKGHTLKQRQEAALP
jgi:hypothetical protein